MVCVGDLVFEVIQDADRGYCAKCLTDQFYPAQAVEPVPNISCTLIPVAQLYIFVRCCGWTEAQARYVTNFSTSNYKPPFYQPPALAVANAGRP